jgi:hypothetical protein
MTMTTRWLYVLTAALAAVLTGCSGSGGGSSSTSAAFGGYRPGTGNSTPTQSATSHTSASTSEPPSTAATTRPAGSATSASIYAALLAGPFPTADLPSAVTGISQFQYADSPPVGYFNGVEVAFGTVQETAALSLKPKITFDVMKTPQYAQGATQEALANLKQYMPNSFVDESAVTPGAWCDTSQASCTALVGRVVVRVDAIASTYGATNGLDVNVPLLTAGVRYARSAGA